MFKIDHLYFSNQFRGSILAEAIWKELLQYNIIYYSAILQESCFFVEISHNSAYLEVLSKDSKRIKHIDTQMSCFKNNNFIHLNADIVLNYSNSFKEVHNSTMYYYSGSKITSDKGVVDIVSTYNFNIQQINELKACILPPIAREIQYSILRNKFLVDLEKDDNYCYLAEFEYFYYKSKLQNKSIHHVLNNEVKLEKDKEMILDLYENYKENNES